MAHGAGQAIYLCDLVGNNSANPKTIAIGTRDLTGAKEDLDNPTYFFDSNGVQWKVKNVKRVWYTSGPCYCSVGCYHEERNYHFRPTTWYGSVFNFIKHPIITLVSWNS